MKVAFDATVLHGRKSGVGYYCEELLRSLAELDHETEYFVFSHRPISPDMEAGNVRFSRSRLFPIRAVYLHALLPQVLNEIQPDLCHYTNFLAPILEHRPYLVTIHDMGLERLRESHPLRKRIYTRRLIPRVARRAAVVLTNSEFSKWDIIRHLGIPEERIRVTPLAASPQFRPIPQDERAPILARYGITKPYFLYVGNLEPRKNLERLLEAFALLEDCGNDLVIAGRSGFRGKRAVERARTLGLNGQVHFPGYIPREDLPALFSGATAFVYPSLLEGFGLPVMEAMACGTAVVTSNSSSLEEIAAGAALLVHPLDVREIAEALRCLSGDFRLRQDISQKGLKRASEFSWQYTAELTHQAYLEAMDRARVRMGVRSVARRQEQEDGRRSQRRHSRGEIESAILKTLRYAEMFDYPLRPDELRERLFDVEIDQAAFLEVLCSLDLKQIAGCISNDENLVKIRAQREEVSDASIQEAKPALRTLASMPFVRMLAFSGATAHRNMATRDDLDLFVVVEDGKLWATLLITMVWSKLKGLRRKICINYMISDRALPLFQHDPFTAQQVASLKPFYGKTIYDQFVSVNPFVRRCFPNFDPSKHRTLYSEIPAKSYKPIAEKFLRLGFVQTLDLASRKILGAYLKRKARKAALKGECEVLLDRRWIKLHMQSHKSAVLQSASVL